MLDVTKYLNDHPGGPEIILEFAGKNADDMFEDIGHSTAARNELAKFVVGNAKVRSLCKLIISQAHGYCRYS